ncbi:MAG: hypothetical protein IKC61_05650 [Clostridia bacterium]|nr:hypothetical protein [Clostridia bacterium]
MKRISKLTLLICLLLLASIFTLTACKNDKPTENKPTRTPHVHTEVIDPAVAPTCTETGLTDGKHCSSCGKVIVKQTVVDALGHNCVDGCCTTCGMVIYIRDDDYILFGEYPQTIKADDVIITDTQDSRGYYLGSDGFYYAKITATPLDSAYTFSTGNTVTSGEVYYFKVEPIRWRILTTDGEKAFILCDSIIANLAYQSDYNLYYFAYDTEKNYYGTTANGAPNGTYANNYKYSEVRKWLNATFYETAFSELQREIILTTMIDNSAESTGFSSNPYACEDTEDKIFLLSHAEVTKSEYGFALDYLSYDTARRIQTSDYTRATGAYMYSAPSYYGKGYWWLRSPQYSYSCHTNTVGFSGDIDYADILSIRSVGIVPAMWIDLNP